MTPQDCILFSGGAPGTEAEFGQCAERYGIDEVNFTFDGHTIARHRGVRVLNHEGKPASGGNVSIDAPGRPLGSWGGSANTNADGTYTFEGVPPGTYIISAMATNPGPASSPKDQRKTIKVAAGQTIEVEIVGR